MSDELFSVDLLFDAIKQEDLPALKRYFALVETDADQFSVLEACLRHEFRDGVRHCAEVMEQKYPQGSQQWLETIGSILPELCVLNDEEAFHKFFPSSDVLSSGCISEIINTAMYHGSLSIAKAVVARYPHALTAYNIGLAAGEGQSDIIEWVLKHHKDRVQWSAAVTPADFFGHEEIVDMLFERASAAEREEVSKHLRDDQKRAPATSQWLSLHQASLLKKTLENVVSVSAPLPPRSKM